MAGAQAELMLPQMYQGDGFGEAVPVVDRYSDDCSGLHPPSAPGEASYELYDYYNLCRCCVVQKDRCEKSGNKAGTFPQRRQRSPGPTSRPASTTYGTLQRKSNAYSRQGNKMENPEAGALAVSAPPPTAALLNNQPFDLDLDLFNPIAQTEGPGNGDPFPLSLDTSHLDAPQTPHPDDQVQQSDTRDATRPETPGTERAANILANGPLHVSPDADALAYDATTAAAMRNMAHENHNELAEDDIWAIEDDETFNSRDAQGFAKLMFPDGDYIVTTHDVEIGRNMEVASHWKRQQKELRREQHREQLRERVPPARKEFAQRELEMYQQEPSQPSLTGDNGQHADASNSSHSLEGRPAPQSAFSETGGALAFAQDSDEEAGSRRGRKKRRSGQHSKSSTSTTSVVPANLHPPVISAEYSQRELFTDDGEPYSRTLATLPIHTQVPEDINKISKKHLLFSFNFQEECWELHVLGIAAYVNAEKLERGDTVILNHNDVIQISSVWIKFKLPDSHRSSPGLSRGTFSQMGLEDVDDLSEEDAQPVATSPARRLSNALEDVESSDNEPKEPKKGKPKLKLKGVKKPQKEKKAAAAKKKPQEDEKTPHKISLKKQQRRRSDESPSPDEEKKAEKGKKPKETIEQPPELKVEESIEGPATVPVFTAEPGSALASVPIDELPQKRKGPGRPPKNGLVSKRDQALVKKKERDYEKAGLAAPPFNKILELVRAETKQKEMLAKMQSGTLPAGTEMPPPVETDLAATAVKAPAAPTPTETGDEANGMPSESSRRPSSPRPKRVARSPSPMKPESSYTEEEMKKPTATYVHILDEILRNHPSGHADLQEIYDRIQKRYPHFKYRAQTQGWQSSVRHNLLSAPRFKETGRSGKGKLWTIDHDVPLEREKKRKPTPPPRPPMPMMNGQYPPYGQQPYGGGYGHPNGQRPVNGGQGYYSPYQHGQPGQHPPNHNMPPRQGPSASGQAPPNQGQAQSQADPFGGLVPEILAVRNAFLSAHATEETMQAKSDWISKCIVVFSNRFHGSSDPPPDLVVEAPEEQKAYADLDAIFKKYEAMKVKLEQQGSSSTQPAAAPPSHSTGASVNVQQPGTVHQQPQQQTVQTAVADGVAYQNANGGLSPTTSQAPAVSAGQSQGAAPTVSANGFVGGTAVTGPHAVPPTSTGQHMQAPSTYSPAANMPPQGSPPQAVAHGPSQTGSQQGTALGSSSLPHSAAPSASPSVSNGLARTPVQAGTNPAVPNHGTMPTASPANNGSAQSPPQSQTRPAAPYQAAMSVPAPDNHGPTQPPPQSQAERTPSHNAASSLPAPVNNGSAQSAPQSEAESAAMSIPAPASNSHAQSPRQSEAKSAAPSPPAVQQFTETTGTKRAAEDDAVTENEAKRAKVEE